MNHPKTIQSAAWAGVLAALLLLISSTGLATPQRSDAGQSSPSAEPWITWASDADSSGIYETSQAASSGIAKKPPTHMQRCQAACRGIKGASAHSKCIHNCMSKR